MNKSAIAIAALASFAGVANAKVQTAEMSAGVANISAASTTEATLGGTNIGSLNSGAVIVLHELQIKTVAAACGCYAGPIKCSD